MINITVDDAVAARIREDGDMEWLKNGKWHRDGDKPAIIYDKSATLMPHGMFWYKSGKWHRDDDKPAVMHATDDIRWFKNDKHYRVGDQPIIIESGVAIFTD